MRHFSFDVLDVKTYHPTKLEVLGGSRPRITLLHARTNKKYFLKSYRHNTREVWAEMLASKLGETVDIEVQAVSLKKLPKSFIDFFNEIYGNYLPENWKPVGALVGNVFPKGHEQLYGSQIVGTPSDPIRLEDVEASIRSTYLDSEDILQAFSDMVIFDAWIGNMDRHHENWAVTQTSISQQLGLFGLTKQQRDDLRQKRKFTQLYDHGSSLLFELDEDKVKGYLREKDRFVREYIMNKNYALLLNVDGNKENIFNIVRNHIKAKTRWKGRFVKSINKIIKVDFLKVAQLILQMPTDGDLSYGLERKSLLYFSLEERVRLLKDVAAGNGVENGEV